MMRGAVLSECMTYRYQLVRQLEREHWHEGLKLGAIAWVMNNPSTADAEVDDATIRKCWGYTLKWGYGHMMVVNTNPYRSTDPAAARIPPADILTANDSWLRYAVTQCPYVVAAWGNDANPELARRAVNVIHQLGPLHALRITKKGQPAHPLYLPGDLQPTLWAPKGLN